MSEIELIIISILLKAPEKLLTVQLEARWFTKYRHVIIAMQKMASEGVEIDAFSLVSEIQGLDVAEVMGWQRSSVGAPANYHRYVEKLKTAFIAQGFRNSVATALQDIDVGEDHGVVMSSMMAKIAEAKNEDGRNHNHTAKDGLRKFIENLEETFDARENGGVGIKTGLPALDSIIGGLHPSDMMIVGARPGAGKTAMAISTIMRVCEQGKRVGFFSTEMSVIQVMGRLASIVAGVSAKKLRDADLDEKDYARLTAATMKIQNYNLIICDKPAITAGEVMLQARAWAMAEGLDFVVVDYLTRIKIDKPSGNQNIDVGEVATTMKNIARVLNIPVMVLAQLNRGSANRSEKKPRMSDLRDSGVIEQEADCIMLLYRQIMDDETASPEFAEIIVDKNRHGEVATVECRYVPHLMRWDSYSEGEAWY